MFVVITVYLLKDSVASFWFLQTCNKTDPCNRSSNWSM